MQMVYVKVVQLCYWQDNTTQASLCTRLFNYYNVVFFSNFLTMATTLNKYIDKFLIKRLV